jgi:hypothetical protein
MLEARRLSIGLGSVLGLTALLLGQATTKGQPASPKGAKAEEYRALTPKDNLSCGARIDSMEFSFGGPPSGELKGYECLDKEGKTRSIKLKSTKMVAGKIETEDFGAILMKSTTGTGATYAMTESQIKKLKTFLGF